MSQRLLRVRELLKREIGAVIEKDFEFQDILVTVNDVDVSPDLKNATVFIGTVGGPEYAGRKAVEKLNKKRAHIQKRVFSRVVLKSSARLIFKLDDSVQRGVGVVALLDEIEANLPPATDSEEDTTPKADAQNGT